MKDVKQNAGQDWADNPHKLTVEEQEATGKYAGRINAASRRVVHGWVETGKLVKDYLAELKQLGNGRANYHEILASHPDCPWDHSQLRNYEAAYEMWEEMGGDESGIHLPMTHWVQVIPRHINAGMKKELLLKAQSKPMTVRELQLEIRRTNEDKAVSMREKPDEWKKATDGLEGMMDRAQEQLMKAGRVRRGRAIPATLSESLVGFVELAIECGFLTAEEITQPMRRGGTALPVGGNGDGTGFTEQLLRAA